MSTLIKNGRIITAEQDYTADIFVENDKVSLIGTNLNNQADTLPVIAPDKRHLGGQGPAGRCY